MFPGDKLLGTSDQVAFDHHSDDALVSVGILLHHIATNQGLLFVVLVAVGMPAIDHETWCQLRFLQGRLPERVQELVRHFGKA